LNPVTVVPISASARHAREHLGAPRQRRQPVGGERGLAAEELLGPRVAAILEVPERVVALLRRLRQNGNADERRKVHADERKPMAVWVWRPRRQQ
jgi:hypothetical protein